MYDISSIKFCTVHIHLSQLCTGSVPIFMYIILRCCSSASSAPNNKNVENGSNFYVYLALYSLFCKRLNKYSLKVLFHNFHLLFHFDSLNFALFFISFQFTVHIKNNLNISCFLYYSPFPFTFQLSLHFILSFLSKHLKFPFPFQDH